LSADIFTQVFMTKDENGLMCMPENKTLQWLPVSHDVVRPKTMSLKFCLKTVP